MGETDIGCPREVSDGCAVCDRGGGHGLKVRMMDGERQ